MAAYAAAVSLMHIIDLLKNHPSPPISLDKQQFDSLTEAVTFLQEFLESYVSPFSYSDKADPLEMRIADAAYAVEDVIESHIVDTIHLSAASTTRDDVEETRCINFCKSLQKVIEDMDLIVKEVAEIVSEKVPHELQMRSDAASHGERKSEMVGFDDVLLQLLDRLTGRNRNREIIPITGMGGIGKTTLARNAFENKLVKDHFDVCLWATISQNYNIEQTLREFLSQRREHLSGEKSNGLGEDLYKYLFGRRFLVVMDDIWSSEVWDKMKFFFPDNNNGSRVIVTTRLSNLAVHLTDSNSHLDMRFLDEVSSWNLFSKTVFGDECFPFELEGIGKQIVKNCKGLPLAIIVIGGLLAKSEHTQGYWEYIEKNLSLIVNSENEGYCLRILMLSYNHLPTYLKPCFLYMGVFEEDSLIVASQLIKLCVSEGLFKPKNNKSLETVAKEYLNELVERNLIMVHYKFGKKKFYQIHDLLRDLSLKEAQKQRFCYVFKGDSPRDINSPRRIVIPRSSSEEEVGGASEYMSHARSYVFYLRIKQLPDFRLLRTLDTSGDFFRDRKKFYFYALEDVFRLVNSRYLSFQTSATSQVPSSVNLLWNLHTLVIYSMNELMAPKEIWRMHQLKHVEFAYGGLRLPDLPSSENDSDIVILENLQTLRVVNNFDLNEEVARRIPNIKKLEIRCNGHVIERVNCLSYLHCLSKLKSLTVIGKDEYLEGMIFPCSLKNLSIYAMDGVDLDYILPKIGLLPFLDTLMFRGGFFGTRKWETVEGQFPSLKSLTFSRTLFLKLSDHGDLEKWTMPEDSSSCFPLLEQLTLWDFETLEEIPSELGEIPTLKSIELICCSESAVLSAKRIIEEQEDFYGEEIDLHVQVKCKSNEQAQALQYLATPNFRVSSCSFGPSWVPERG